MKKNQDWQHLLAELRDEFALRRKKSQALGTFSDADKTAMEKLQREWIAGKLAKINGLLPWALSVIGVNNDMLRQVEFRHRTASASGIPLRAVQHNDIYHLHCSLWLMVPHENHLPFLGFVYEIHPSIPSTAEPILEKDFGLLDTEGFWGFWEPILLVLETKEGLLRQMVRSLG